MFYIYIYIYAYIYIYIYVRRCTGIRKVKRGQYMIYYLYKAVIASLKEKLYSDLVARNCCVRKKDFNKLSRYCDVC